MKKKEIATALGLSVALTMTTTGCASQTDVDAMNSQITELTAQMESLQTELSEAQAESNATTSKNAELESQVAELQAQLESAEGELEDAESVIKSADDDIAEMTINVTKYAESGSTVFAKPEEAEEYKVMELELNTECYVVATFSDATDEGLWSAIATLVTVDADGNESYQVVSNVEKGTEKSKNKKINFMLRGANAFTVDGKTIKADELGENQEIRIVYARTSLLSNSKVTEQQHTSAEKSSTPKQSTPQQTAPADDGWGYIPPEMIVGHDAPPIHGLNIQFN